MDSLGMRTLRSMIQQQSGPCVSVYLPTHAGSENGQQDPVRLKNLLQRAEQQLVEQGVRPAAARRMLQAARDVPADAGFWEGRGRGLALFITPADLARYRLPQSVRESVQVGKRYHLKPLLAMYNAAERFFVLSLSQQRARLWRGARDGLQELAVEGLPAGIKEALNYTVVGRGTAAHPATPGGLGKQGAVFHAQGNQAETHKEDLAAYFRLIDLALQSVLRDQRSPLLLAGVAYLLPIYREVSSYPCLAAPELAGNHDHLSAHQLFQRVWPLVEPLFAQTRLEATQRHAQLVGTPRTSRDIRQILPAANAGRVDTVFVDREAQQWGTFHPDTGDVELHGDCQAGDEDLLDLAAVETLAHRGTVYAVATDQVPGGTPVAAMFRW